jgi:glycosyltransferase involved in cell wall biosynthesis
VTARLSVVIPAHDEERVIARLLRGLAPEAAQLDIVVVANGCRDATARIARGVDPRIRVLEISEASKPAALDVGDAVALAFPRAYVDADVEVTGRTLLALADLLDHGPALVASPDPRLDLSEASRSVIAYYAVWELSEYRRSGHIGSGVYALSRDGRTRFDHFPRIIGDDRFVQGLFAPHERATLGDHEFTVRPPRTLRALIRRGARIAAGNRQLRAAGLAGHEPARSVSFAQLFRRVAPHPSLWAAFLLYCVVQLRTAHLAEHILATEEQPAWTRDETSRV